MMTRPFIWTERPPNGNSPQPVHGLIPVRSTPALMKLPPTQLHNQLRSGALRRNSRRCNGAGTDGAHEVRHVAAGSTTFRPRTQPQLCRHQVSIHWTDAGSYPSPAPFPEA